MNFSAKSRILVQGMTGRMGATHTQLMLAYGTPIVAGVTPGRGGQEFSGIPVFDLVEQAQEAVGNIDTSVIFVPAYYAVDAALEAIESGIRQIVIITEGIPPLDMVRLVRKAEATETLVIGPNCPGVIVPHQKLLIGIHPGSIYTPGCVGLISRSGTLTYEIASELSRAGLGQSIGVGIGGDTIIGSSLPQWLQTLDEDEPTEVIVLVGEIGGSTEEEAAQYISETIEKPVIAYIAGRSAPLGKRMGHAGAITAGGTGTADSKIAAFKAVGIPVAERPSQIPELVAKALKKSKD
ncbi:succinate--CoA ligase subunit alpha [Leptolyngbya sp. FACHB-261]|nr:succinate--CoA ligase subunit alpha [Leptolyngbya sp. FACHB-261]